MYSVFIWVFLFIVFVILESCTYQLICTWFAIGAAVSAVCASLGLGIVWQIVIFALVSSLCLLMLRKVALKLIKPDRLLSNTDSVVGKKITLLADADDATYCGKAKVNGIEWSVRCKDGESMQAGSTAYVEKVEGVKLIISGKKE